MSDSDSKGYSDQTGDHAHTNTSPKIECADCREHGRGRFEEPDAKIKRKKGWRRPVPVKTVGLAAFQQLYREAVSSFRTLKRKHRLPYESDPRQFRQVLRKAEGQVFNQKRGPKDDPNIATAAWEVAHGDTIEAAFNRRYPSNHLKSVNEALYVMVLKSFSKNVNRYIGRHHHLKRLYERMQGGIAEHRK